MLTAGVDGAGWNGSFDSSGSFKGGYSASYGDPIAGALGSTMGISGLQMAGAINSTMAGISSVTGIANRVGQVANYTQRFTGGGGGGIASSLPANEYGVAMSNIQATSSLSTKGIDNAMRSFSVEMRLGNKIKLQEVPEHNNFASLNLPKANSISKSSKRNGGNGGASGTGQIF